MRKVYVKKQGNVCTVFLGPDGSPQPLHNFTDAPGAPFTCNLWELRNTYYPGAEFEFVEEQFPEPPTAPGADGSFDQLVTQLTGSAPQSSPSPATQQSHSDVNVTTLPLPAAASSKFADRLLDAFKAEVLSMKAGEIHSADLEYLGSFLITALPELEEELVAATKIGARPKKVFKL